MNHFLKVFLISLLIFSMVITTGIYTYTKFFNYDEMTADNPGTDPEDGDDEVSDSDSPLERAIKKSKRINVLLLGLEGTRSDTIMIASYDRISKEANIISIPRDTYYPREGYAKYSEFMKINAVYGTEEARQQAVVDAVEELTKIPIHKYVSIDYNGVRAAVDAVGGVEFDVPFHMKYTDIYDKPPLRIDIPAGRRTIKGDKAMELLRFRKGDPGYPGYPEGDVGRIKTQQEFVKAAVDKALGMKLPNVISAVYPYVKTDFSLTELLGLGGDVIGFSKDKINVEILPGDAKYIGNLSFFIPDDEKIREKLYELYKVPLKVENNEPETDNTDNTGNTDNTQND